MAIWSRASVLFQYRASVVVSRNVGRVMWREERITIFSPRFPLISSAIGDSVGFFSRRKRSQVVKCRLCDIVATPVGSLLAIRGRVLCVCSVLCGLYFVGVLWSFFGVFVRFAVFLLVFVPYFHGFARATAWRFGRIRGRVGVLFSILSPFFAFASLCLPLCPCQK